MGDRERIERFEESARRCLEARDGRDLGTQLALTRAAVKYDRAAAQARYRAAARVMPGRENRA